MNYDALIATLAQVHQQAQAGAAGAVNRHLILRNWLIGAYLVEFEQNGEDRAQYGERLLERVAADLRRKAVSGCSRQMLQRMRLFYLLYPQVRPEISSPPVSISAIPLSINALEICSPPVSNSQASAPGQPRPLPVHVLLRLSWTHLVDLLALEDPWKRAFYENECLKGNWSKRQLQRQIGSLLYERTGLSTDKQAVIERARQQAAEAPGQIADLIAQGDQPPVGLLLCTDKNQTKVEYATAGLDHQLFVSRYLVALPKPEQLQHLIETDRAVWEQRHAETANND